MTSASPRYEHAARVVGRRVHGTMVLVRLETLEACELNALGGRVWELATARTAEEIAAIVAAESDAAPDDVRIDVATFLADLERGAFVVSR